MAQRTFLSVTPAATALLELIAAEIAEGLLCPVRNENGRRCDPPAVSDGTQKKYKSKRTLPAGFQIASCGGQAKPVGAGTRLPLPVGPLQPATLGFPRET
jgi:hypothetical protein